MTGYSVVEVVSLLKGTTVFFPGVTAVHSVGRKFTTFTLQPLQPSWKMISDGA